MKAVIIMIVVIKMVTSLGGLVDYIQEQQNSRMELIRIIEEG